MNGTDCNDDTCANYYPLQDGKTLSTHTGLSLTLLETSNSDEVTVRKLWLTNEIISHAPKSRLVTQFQFQSWKEHDQVMGHRLNFFKIIVTTAFASVFKCRQYNKMLTH